MMQLFITDAVISKGYDGAPAIYFSDDGKMASFKVGNRVYDKKAEKETRWVNINVTLFDELVQRIKKMNLKEGSHINLIGMFDMRPWVREDGSVTTWPTIRASLIEFATSTAPRSEAQQTSQKPVSERENAYVPPEELPGFTGYEQFGDANPYYNEKA